ncbi:CBO0543 family protein [Bacillus suaedae]|uniref:Uncharacterized protein n=1 Tax=Halalkalibacter suaedae TaxID=2822140 RepID=A0A940WYD8_9BACI|nr:CBO0543 family protein [Bacillus suaedae]MBP3953057.1 hypothetical protein [Bacillus suaedae]
MHIFTAIISIIAVFIWGDWRNWKTYHSTILFFALGNLLYNFLTANHILWRLQGNVVPNHSLTEMLYTFVIFPATAILFLGNYPNGILKQLLHTLQWIAIYGIWEFVYTKTGHIEYQHGWSLSWSIFVLFIMFPLLRLHVNRPLLAYLLYAVASVFLLWWFEIPVHISIEDR